MKTLRIATRGSALALWQAEHIRDTLLAKDADLCVILTIIKTKGDIIQDVPLAKVGGKGLFVKEIEEALLSGEADLAVHSMKDVPMDLPEGLVLAAIPEREDPADMLLSVDFDGLAALPKGARVGTCSLRRQAQLLMLRPDLKIENLRGNVDTRLRKLMEGQFEAIVMAAAGLARLGLSAPHMSRLAPPNFLPAVGQGALGIECLAERADLMALLATLDHPFTRVCTLAERAFSRALNGGCQAPIAGHATLCGELLHMEGLVASLDGTQVVRHTLSAQPDDAEALGTALAQHLLNNGARPLLP